MINTTCKPVLIVSFILLYCNLVKAQSPGTIRQIQNKAGTQTYVYSPPSKLALPTPLFISLVYKVNDEYFVIRKPLNPKNGKYNFTLSLPDTVLAFIATITGDQQKPVDNNSDTGYTIFCNSLPGSTAEADLEAAYLLSDYAPYALDLDRRTIQNKLISHYQNAFTAKPTLPRNRQEYRYYLYLRYEQNGIQETPAMLDYAQKMESENDENSMVTALYIYRFLKLDDKINELEKRCIEKYPIGEIAREKFINEFYDKTGKTETSIQQDASDYQQRFNDSSSQMKYTFYSASIQWLLFKKQYQKLPVYEQKLERISFLPALYDEYARALMDEKNQVTDSTLSASSQLLQRAMTIIGKERSSKHPSPDDYTFQRTYNQVAGTYAKLLYLREQYDSAYYYQSCIVNKQFNPRSSQGAIVHLVNYAQKAKGDKYARSLALEHVKKGNGSQELLLLLGQLNQRLGIRDTDKTLAPLDEEVYAAQKMTAAITRRLGSLYANNFELPNLEGENISLASYKNKIVVLDFWATWCGPCKASFPHMQEVVKKYEKDSSVVFLFIDTWERKSLEQMKSGVARFLSDNGYKLHILLDHENKAGNAYKVDFVPETFVIGRNGKISYMGSDNRNIVAEIEKAKGFKP